MADSANRLDAVQQQMLEHIIDSMDREGRAWVKGWSFGGFPVNGTTGNAYRGRNALLLWYQMLVNDLEDPRFVTFNQAKAAGLSVRKGSKSSVVERWRRFLVLREDPNRRIPQPRTDEELDRLLSEQGDRYTRTWRPVGYWSVFNASQLDGDLSRLVPVPDRARIEIDGPLIDALESVSPCPVTEEYGDRACYGVGSDTITMPKRTQFLSTDSFARTLLHEMCHATGAAGRLNRDGFDPKAGPIDIETRALEELVAELGSLYTANAVGLDLSGAASDPAGEEADPFENSVTYLKGWAQRTGDARGALMKQAAKAADAQRYLVEQCFEPKLGKDLFRNLPEAPEEARDEEVSPNIARPSDRPSEKEPDVVLESMQVDEEHLVAGSSREEIEHLAAKAGWDVEIFDTDVYDVHAVFSLPGSDSVLDVPFAHGGGLYSLARATRDEVALLAQDDPVRTDAQRLSISLGSRWGWYEEEQRAFTEAVMRNNDHRGARR